MNIFREAKNLLDKRDAGSELSEEELRLINTAIIPLMEADGIFPNDITIAEGLEELAKIVGTVKPPGEWRIDSWNTYSRVLPSE